MTIFIIIALIFSSGVGISGAYCLYRAKQILIQIQNAKSLIPTDPSDLRNASNTLVEVLKTPESPEVQETLVKQAALIQELETKIQTLQRPQVGVVAAWQFPSEDRSAYILQVYNDTNDKIFNLSFTAPEEYEDVHQINHVVKTIEAGQAADIHFFPQRQEFAEVWLDQKLNPLIFTLQYADAPVAGTVKTIQVPFEIKHTSQHLRQCIKLTKQMLDAKAKNAVELVQV